MSPQQAVKKSTAALADELDDELDVDVRTWGSEPTDAVKVIHSGNGLFGRDADKIRERGFELSFTVALSERADKLVFKRVADR